MAVRAYILIGTAVGTAGTVYKGLHKLAVTDAKVLSAETVTGPFDVIALLESEDLDRLGRAVTEGIQRIYGVERTTTCLVMGSA
ncbi:MAG TPA: Lrp/AsnC ligand binding domain-containing protein [Dehalococcoidia bacterium]|nr:Lrp/AsnC ligand binding domain-containing protein [Dehalococcoidia bacterium]